LGGAIHLIYSFASMVGFTAPLPVAQAGAERMTAGRFWRDSLFLFLELDCSLLPSNLPHKQRAPD
jgi:hypothetical protein